jgi:hypothetical protein
MIRERTYKVSLDEEVRAHVDAGAIAFAATERSDETFKVLHQN